MLVADVIVRPVDRLPERGRLQLVEGIDLHSGGPAHTTAVALATLGVETAVVGRVGEDPFGAFLIEVLGRHGIESHVRRDGEAATSMTIVAVGSGGERSFLHLVGANGTLVAGDVADALLARALLTRLGHRPTLAPHGEAAVESWLAARAAGTPYDLVLMDVQMPGMDGLEATRRIRAAETEGEVGQRPTRILALTANAMAEDREAALTAGMDGLLVKPLDRERLREALEHVGRASAPLAA